MWIAAVTECIWHEGGESRMGGWILSSRWAGHDCLCHEGEGGWVGLLSSMWIARVTDRLCHEKGGGIFNIQCEGDLRDSSTRCTKVGAYCSNS